ncbi:MAG TPA: hypothetical protein VJH03_05290 [Blastocatellia bacterium]|nr:hypothetical protein [Blastocatellia bacterium]
MKITIALIACLVMAPGAFIASAQQEHAAVRIAGTVSPSLVLSLNAEPVCFGEATADGAEPQFPDAQAPRVTAAAVENADGNAVQITIAGKSGGGPSRVTVPLAIRTNAAYKLGVRAISSDGCVPDMNAAITSIRPSGSAVVANAETSCRPLGPVLLDSSSGLAVLLEGGRVSARGNATSSGNALIVEVTLKIEGGHGQACNWRTSLRATIDRAS